ncbi:DnaJ domain-containing protein [Leptospira sp. 96542]|nr:DnaJ domain-containing protein [Leptospira sp. 96542]
MNLSKKENHYQILGVDKNASSLQIGEAYSQRLAFWEPMLQLGISFAKEEILNLTRSFQVLSDAEKRKEYDSKLDFDFVLLDGKTKDPEMEEAYDVYRTGHKKTYEQILAEFTNFKEDLGFTLVNLKLTTIYLVLCLIVYSVFLMFISFIEESYPFEGLQTVKNLSSPVFLILTVFGYWLFRKRFKHK